MQTVIYQEVDGHKIVKGFSRLSINPVETAEAIKAVLPETEEHLEIQAMQDEMMELKKKADISLDASMKAFRSKKEKEAGIHARDHRQTMLDVEKQMKELKKLLPGFAAAKKRLKQEHAVYFLPARGEEPVSDDVILSLRKKMAELPERTYLATDGSLVEDKRGTLYFKKTSGVWISGQLSKLGADIPKGAIKPDDLSDAQRAEIESQRVSGLSRDQKDSELAIALASAMKNSKGMRSTLDIQGDPDALNKAQVFYDELEQELQEKYK